LGLSEGRGDLLGGERRILILLEGRTSGETVTFPEREVRGRREYLGFGSTVRKASCRKEKRLRYRNKSVRRGWGVGGGVGGGRNISVKASRPAREKGGLRRGWGCGRKKAPLGSFT